MVLFECRRLAVARGRASFNWSRVLGAWLFPGLDVVL